MKAITGAVTLDREFLQAAITLGEQLLAPRPLPMAVNGLSGGAQDAFVAELTRTAVSLADRPALILVSDEKEGTHLASLLTAAGVGAAFYPARDLVFYNISASHDVERERLSVLSRLAAGERLAVITTPYAALQYTMPHETLASLTLTLSAGDTVEPDALCATLSRLGFARAETVEGIGQFARRGGILDFFPATSVYPIRMEFFGDEIDRMGYFDPATQRIGEDAGEVYLLPAKEVLPTVEDRESIRNALASLVKKAPSDESRRALSGELAAVEGGLELPFADRFLSLVYPASECLLDHLRQFGRMAVLTLDSAALEEHVAARLKLLEEDVKAMLEGGMLQGKYASFAATATELDNFLSENVAVRINPFGGSTMGRLSGLFGFRCRRTVSYADKINLLFEDLASFRAGDYRVLIAVENEAGAQSLRKTLADAGVEAVTYSADETINNDNFPTGTVGITVGRISSGFELLMPKVAVLSMVPDGSAARRRRKRMGKGRVEAGKKILSYADLSAGDYVVHENHGIGQFLGMQQLTVDGVTRDYITIRYAGTDQLFLPADRLEYISKYIGAGSEDGSVKLSKMGGDAWQKSKSRAKAAVADMAKDLIALYAARQSRRGFAFGEDTDLEAAFDDAFEFEETDPQITAIAEIKADMMKETPMDRLLCGDVGFGKTEVAFRAIFKAIVNGKQAAILVPTTILALQHYQTAISRMRGFPVNVEMLSRFRTPKEQEAILRRLRRGETDLIVGTHRLLGKDVVFKDLGLLVVDEEQRFGVGQKEKLKAMAQDVDVLTLTATPIPRTLNMAMSGIRDMSVLDEAPTDRYPVQTYVLEHDDIIINEAVRKELARGGQVLYLYNRVETIDRPAGRLRRAFPDAAITVAHGKMEKDELEEIWQALVRGEIDILVCTTIIETGVDLPNANTLVIEDADRMGLSQLHQIRGRVGRSGRHAYAYFTYRKGKELSEVAEKRLGAIREYAEFGAGFRIALRDLEIRGAGNLLGAEQHGHIDAVGYDMYVKLLNDAMAEAKGEKKEAAFEAAVDFRMDANIPEKYIRTSSERMEMYKKISLIQTEEDERDVLDELCDRYGEPPLATQRLLWAALTRALCARHRISKVEQKDGYLRFYTSAPTLAVWAELFAEDNALRMAPSALSPCVTRRLSKGEDAVDVAAEIMRAYHKCATAQGVNKS